MTISNYKDLNIGILGLGKTGISVFKFLQNNNRSIICYDDNNVNCDNFSAQFGENYIANLEDDAWTKCNKIIISPGIPRLHKIFDIAKKYDINIASDMELFLQNNPSAELVLITGTNGKSTTTALVGHILQQNGYDFIVGGNIGIPVLDLPQGKAGYVLELSSFQLELLGALEAKVSVITNITPDHLDRHGTMEEYIRIKKKILMHEGFKVLGIDNEITADIYNNLKTSEPEKVIGFSAMRNHDEVISCIQNIINDDFFDQKKYTMPETASLVGLHNAQNISASFAVCRALGVQGDDIIRSILTFPGLEHRMQFIQKIGQISVYNDSKATNTDSAKASLSSLKNIFWLVGGVFKEEEFILGDNELKNIRKAYIFGKDKEIFVKYLTGKKEYIIAQDMENALQEAYKDAITFNGECNILLAPACASFDQFKSYEDRGNQFVKFIKNIAANGRTN